MDWISAIVEFFFDQLANAASLVDRHFDLPKLVLAGAVLILVFAVALAKSRR
jgi:hypothetical protein